MGATREARRNAYLYCKFRDEQFALYDEYAKRHGMMMKGLLVANALYYAEAGMTQREICRRTLLSKQTVHMIVKRMLAEGSAEVAEAKGDARSKTIRMTEAGRSRCGGVVRHITCAEDAAMAMLSPEEQAQLVELSRRFTGNLTMLVNQEMEEEDGVL